MLIKKLLILMFCSSMVLANNGMKIESLFDLKEDDYTLKTLSPNAKVVLSEKEKIEFSLNKLFKVFFLVKGNVETKVSYKEFKKEKDTYMLKDLIIDSPVGSMNIEKAEFKITEESLINFYKMENIKTSQMTVEKLEGVNEDMFYKILYSNIYPKKVAEYSSTFYGLRFLDKNYNIFDLLKNYEISEETIKIVKDIGDEKFTMTQHFTFNPLSKDKMNGKLELKIWDTLTNVELVIESNNIVPKKKLATYFGNNEVDLNKVLIKIDKTEFNNKFQKHLTTQAKKDIEEYKKQYLSKNVDKLNKNTKALKSKNSINNLKLLEFFRKDIQPFVLNETNKISYEITTKEQIPLPSALLLYKTISTGNMHILKDVGTNLLIKKNEE